MRRENTPWQPVQAAAIDWSDTGTPHSKIFDDVYYSRENGLAESRHIFLQGNRLPQRWQERSATETFCIAETGFGTGLNFLMTWQAWRELPAPRPRLHYLSFERHPLSPQDMRLAPANWPELQALSDELLASYPGLLPGQHRLILASGQITLDLWWEDVTHALPDLASRDSACIDAWYLDGFAPARNEAMWTEPIYRAVAGLSQPGATFSTFTAAGHVRRGLAAAGFGVDKVAGYGRKRESLRGSLQAPATPPASADTPWDLSPCSGERPEHVIVVGAGLAGCTTAAALARRGIRVTLLEQGRLAGGGSGNEQGILYTRLSRKHSALTDFALQSFHFAANYYRQAFDDGRLCTSVDGSLCGSFHQSDNERDMSYLREALQAVPALAQVVTTARANELLGVDQHSAGFWYPASGWLRPVSVCQSLVSREEINLLEHCGAIRLHYQDNLWRACAGESLLAESPCAIIATGPQAVELPQLNWLPLQSIRGQTTQLPSRQATQELKAALCHEGYIAPARNGSHCIGATFTLQDSSQDLKTQDHRANLHKLASAVPAWREQLERLPVQGLEGRVGFRCASPDYLPLVGPVPDRISFLETFAALRKNARQTIPQRGNYLAGLYLTTGHGSRGLSSTPLAAELLASQISGEPAPLSRELCRALAPARFLVRDLARNRI